MIQRPWHTCRERESWQVPATRPKKRPVSTRNCTSGTSVHRLKPTVTGKIVAIDVDSGSWAIAESEIVPVGHLREMHPGAVNILSERVGYRALRSFWGTLPAVTCSPGAGPL